MADPGRSHGARDELFGRLRAGDASATHLWPVARQVLFAADPRDEEAFWAVADRCDLEELVAFSAIAQAASAREEPRSLQRLLPLALARGLEHQDILREAVTGCADGLLSAARTIVVELLTRGSDDLAHRAAATLARLIARGPDLASSELERIVEAVCDRSSEVKEDRGEQVAGRFARELRAQPAWPQGLLPTLRRAYGRFGKHGKAELIRLHLLPGVDDGERLDLLLTARRYPVENLVQARTVDLVTATWPAATRHPAVGWDGWRALLADDLPKGWEPVQWRAVAWLAGRDPVIVADLVAQVRSGSGDFLRRCLQVAQLLAKAGDARLVEELIAGPPPLDPRAGQPMRSVCSPSPSTWARGCAATC